MENGKTIGLIGYGKLGKALTKRIESKTGQKIHTSSKKEDNCYIAKQSDILILTVKPYKIAEVITQIRDCIRAETIIVSFAAATQKDFIRQGISNTVVRCMTDIEFEQVMTEENVETNDLCSAISQNELVLAETEEQVDAFTVLIGCLPGVAAWQYAYNSAEAETWLANYMAFIAQKLGVKIQVARNICNKVLKAGDFETTIEKVATKGGVTESLIESLKTNKDISLSELFEKGMEQIRAMQKRMLKTT